MPVGSLRDVDVEHIGDGREEVDARRQCVADAGPRSGPGDEQRDVAECRPHGNGRLAPGVLLAEVVPVIGAHDDRGRRPEVVTVEGPDEATEPVVDHGELGPVLSADLATLALVDHALAHSPADVRRPDEMRSVPVGVVHGRVGIGRVEGLVGIELVDHQQEAVVATGVLLDPLGGRRHRAGTREVALASEPPARGVVVVNHPLHRRRTDPARVGHGLPRIALVAALVVPRAEVDVVVLAPGLEQMGMVAHQLRRHAGVSQRTGDGVLPDLDRPPWLPQEVHGAAQQIVAGRHAGQRARVVLGEPDGPVGEGVEVGRLELGAAVGPDQVPVQAVEQHHHDVVRRRRPALDGLVVSVGCHGPNVARGVPSSPRWPRTCAVRCVSRRALRHRFGETRPVRFRSS